MLANWNKFGLVKDYSKQKGGLYYSVKNKFFWEKKFVLFAKRCLLFFSTVFRELFRPSTIVSALIVFELKYMLA